ncbi:tail protein [Xenorhabdus stockiae]|uniref:Tail protein n=1 Tax=Xenorhabdus stockiae TaxID=351614 RepID=A0A2D0KB32_9GAMM|nr:phage tail protein [Xenorhabdus stockiae]PHM60679.1 tail protein [Xenorhabdus stockiae]
MQDKKPDAKTLEDNVSVPTMEDVRRAIREAIEEHIASRDHPYATLEDKGFVTLSNEVESESEITVATSKAVKIAYDLANKANTSDKDYVPTSRKINGKELSSDISLNASDVGAYSTGETDKHINDAKALANAAQIAANNANNNANGRVPSSRTVNGKPLSGDITLNAADVGAYSRDEADKHINDAKALANAAQIAANNANNNANARLSKDQNGADIPNKVEFVKNLGLAVQDSGESSLPVGVPIPWPTTTPPTGWLICNGNYFDKSRYPKLALAYPSGRLPDLRGEFIRGLDSGRNVDPGRWILSWQNFSIQRHSHNIEINDSGSASFYVGRGNWKRQGSVNTGEFGGSETRPRNIAFLYIVRAA